MKILFTVILGIFLFTSPGHAQGDDVTTATTALQGVLANLKQSIQQLSLDNELLASRDQEAKDQVLHLQMQLEHGEAQGDALYKQSVQLQAPNPHRSQQIQRLENENTHLDDRIQKTEGDIRSIQQSLDAEYQDEQKLLQQLKGTSNTIPVVFKAPPQESQAAAQHEKERLKLLKLIYDSQERQGLLHHAILDLQKKASILPASALAQQQLLKEQIKDLEAQLAALQPESPTANLENLDQLGDAQLGQLEVELKALEKNYLQLKDLMEKMSKKAQEVRMSAAQKTEVGKLQNSMDDLTRQNTALRADLDALRTQLIELDRRKSYLELMTRRSRS